jgi:hypothetical protein
MLCLYNNGYTKAPLYYNTPTLALLFCLRTHKTLLPVAVYCSDTSSLPLMEECNLKISVYYNNSWTSYTTQLQHRDTVRFGFGMELFVGIFYLM